MNTHDNSPDPKAGPDLVRWLDGELSPHETRAMEQRLEADPSLRREAEVLSELEGLLEQRPNSGEAPDVRAAVLARIERDLNEDVGWRILPRFLRMPVWAASWAACGILLAFVVLGVIEMEPSSAGSDDSSDDLAFEIASLDDDLSFADMIDEAFDASGTPVDSMATWLEEPEADGTLESGL